MRHSPRGTDFSISTASAEPLESEAPLFPSVPRETGAAQGVIAWSSFLFALLQSVCTFFGAVEGLRLVIGVSALAISASVGTVLDRFHADWIRVPMMVLALGGSLLNLVVILQIRRLRNRPAARWRQQPVAPGKIRKERIQLLLSVATLVLIGIEEYMHIRWCGHP